MSSRSKTGAKNGSKKTRSNAMLDVKGGCEVQVEDGACSSVSVVVEENSEANKQPDETLPGQACKTCDGPDTDDMVQCDECDKGPATNYNPQPESSASEAIIRPQKRRTSSYRGSTTSGAPPFQSPKTDTSFGTKAESKQSVTGALSVVSRISSKCSLLKLELKKLEEEHELEKQAAEKRRLYVDRKYDILKQLANRSNVGSCDGLSRANDGVENGRSRVNDWIKNVNAFQDERNESNQCSEYFSPRKFSTFIASCTAREQSSPGNEQRSESNKSHHDQQSYSEVSCSYVRNFSQRSIQESETRNQRRENKQRTGTGGSYNGNPNDDELNQSIRQSHTYDRSGYKRASIRGPSIPFQNHSVQQHAAPPTRQQLAARQAVSRDLPTFSGNPEDWPIFFSSFNSTTSMCGFSNDENIVRLQKCLKGRAYEAVKSRLMHPSNVPGIIGTLQMMFGQPEAIVCSLMSKINAMPPLKEEKLETIVEFAVSVQNFCATVDACGLEDHLYNVSLLQQLVNKLPSSIKLDWARHRRSVPRVNLATFGNWVYSLAEVISTVSIPSIIQEPKLARNDGRNNKKTSGFLNAHLESPEQNTVDTLSNAKYAEKTQPVFRDRLYNPCSVCKGTCKTVEKCKRFLDLSRDGRWAAIREFGLCRTCLRCHNGNCKAKPSGKNGCTVRHHELLHNDQKAERSAAVIANPVSVASTITESNQSHGCNLHRTLSSAVLFRYLPVVLQGINKTVHTYAFFDDGSELTLLDNKLAEELQLDGEISPLCLRWTGGRERHEENSRIVDVGIAGMNSNATVYNLRNVRTVEELLLPPQTLDAIELSNMYPHLRGLPIKSYRDAQPRILIGLKHTQISLVLQIREGGMDQPIAAKTRLGWTVYGGSIECVSRTVQCAFHEQHQDQRTEESMHQAMKDYFALDSTGVSKPDNVLLSTEDRRSQHLLQSLTKFRNGRYETGLLWRFDHIRLPDSRAMALRRFHCLENRMKKDPGLAEAFNSKIFDYLAKGYIRQLSLSELARPYQRTWYLPIFPVTNPNKPGKLRIVWDAAATSYGQSLNTNLLKGPDQLSSLFSILLQFRKYRIGLTGDIREMFHQVDISEQDQQCQRFYWRDESGEIGTFVMRVMTFGSCCSPSCAQYVKNINAQRHSRDYPEAAEVIIKSHYVDDMLVSVESEEQAIELAQKVKFVHSQGGFEIRNWISNSNRVLAALKEGSIAEKNLDLTSEMGTEKVLGMWWCTTSNTFTYRVGWSRLDRALLEGRRHPTKREVLRVLMTIFDPLGLIANFLMFLKILLQEVWRSGVQWDDPIDELSYEKWKLWLKVLPEVEKVSVPRCYRVLTSLSARMEIQLHTFVDASENGFAATVHLRYVQNGMVECNLVSAKTRVAPLKFTSIPRLELQAAVIGTRLARTIEECLSTPISKRYFWTDSWDVICWINSDHRRYSQFVAFRISEILELTEINEWRWVPTKLNVADDATKWVGRPNMTPENRWFKGPEFLQRPEEEWPKFPTRKSSTTAELRPSLLLHYITPDAIIIVNKYSSWKRLVNVVARVYRFPANCHRKQQGKPIVTGPLTTEELQTGECYLYRRAQIEAYPEEIAILLKAQEYPEEPRKQIPKNSELYQLSPVLDRYGVVRMQGRTRHCVYATEDAKNPIVMPRDHYITTLIIAYYHNKYHPQNHETTVNELRQKYKIARLRVCYAKVRRQCQRCKNDSAVPYPPIMADLPPARVAAFSRPFTHVGVDYFGPMEVVVGRRVEKRWGMLATCLTIRAIHIELVHSLNTDSCIMALRRFIARRGTPKVLFSDRGTNFVGASRELREAEGTINQQKIMEEFVSTETQWLFNPPAAPHMGGSWERLIRTVKKNLASICPTKKPTDEVLRSLLTEIESVVNSRPLTHVPIDDESDPALTPNHLLLGSSNGTKPLSVNDNSGLALKQGWRTSQTLANQFWKRWLTDYLPEITRRTKWFVHTRPVRKGDIVVIVDPKLPRNCWPKGKVIDTCVSKDNQIRSATVRTASGVYERPVTKLAVLDVLRD
ncbi:uncharacterized protein LOC131439240 [Malaya genurostris]|uniref:uncharacterized protein LOC131439240 n=1 Tax=Malaya genurostris TaxID=325434 RepID=UPI0026F40952|nr:uncharacterized protein LOC131439240 [Malaya genurostris]